MTKRIAISELEGMLADVQDAMQYACNSAEPVCCEKPFSACCGSPEPDWPEWAQWITTRLHPVEQTLSAIVASHNPTGYVEVPDELVEGE